MALSLQTAGWLVVGLMLGAVNVWLIRLSVDRYTRSPEGNGRLTLLPGLFARIILVTGLLFLAVRSGLVNGAAALVGYWVGRTLMLRGMSRRSADAALTTEPPSSVEQEPADQSFERGPAGSSGS